jgi:glycosyltransferase involved in cell wall biosynthesis
MKITHVVDSMEVGGAETVVAQMCRLQREQGYDPCVCSITTLGPLGAQLRQEGFAVKTHVGQHLTDSVRNFYRIFKASRPDVVHLHNPTPAVYAGAAARLAGVPCIVSTRHSLVAPPRRLMVELKYAVAARFCDWIVGICEATTNNLKSMHSIPSRKIICVYNGAVPVRHVAQNEQPQKSGFTLVYVGRLEPVKNHALLLNAFRAALSDLPELRLWMVGDGNEREMLERLAAELDITRQVTFWGQQLDVAPYFSAADAFIMSSKSEGLPISLLQAFSLGVPAIVNDVGGMAEVVRLANAGIAAPAGDSAGMAAAILRLANNDALREEYSRNAGEAFVSRFSLQTMVDAYTELYRSRTRA